MSDNPTERRTVRSLAAPASRTVVDRLAQSATIIHPTIAGDDQEFEVVIERVYYRSDEGEREQLCFRGKATAGTWSGYKTFFVDECKSAIDRKSGNAVSNIADWLISLRPAIDPLTLASLGTAAREHLRREINIVISKTEAIVAEQGTTLRFTEISEASPSEDDSEQPYAAFEIFLSGVSVTSFDDPITTEPLYLAIVEPEEAGETRTDGNITITTTRRTMTLNIEVVPCAGGRVDIRRV